MSFGQNTFAEAPFGAEGAGNVTVGLSGLPLAFSVGSETVTAGALISVSGVPSTFSVGNTGISLPSGITVIGLGAAVSTGSVSIISVNNLVMTGIGMTVTVSDQVVSKGDAIEGVVGAAVTGGLGDESIVGTANVDITGIGMTSSVGTVDTGIFATIAQAGIAMTSSTGTVDVADVVMGPTGIGLTASVGDGVASIPKDVDVTGTGMALTLAEEVVAGDSNTTITTSDNGTLSMLIGLGSPDVGAGIAFGVSGVSATGGVGDLFFWDSIPTGTDVTWDKVA
jgi:hypothetical protein